MGEGVREMLRVGKLDRVRPNARLQQALLKLCVIGCQRGPRRLARPSIATERGVVAWSTVRRQTRWWASMVGK